MPLYVASLEQINYFNFRLSPLNFNLENTPLVSMGDYTFYEYLPIVEKWDYGSHNYFLNTAIGLGLIPAVLLLIIINLFLIRLYDKIKNNLHIRDNLPKLFFIALIASFAVFSATGNAFSGSTGLLLFLLFGCLNLVIYSVKKKGIGL